MEINFLNTNGEVKGKSKLPEHVTEADKVNSYLLHEVISSYLSNQRKGTHATLTRGNVTGGGKKPWKQKGTGRARAGTSRSPLWRKGGIMHGPQPRSYVTSIPRAKIRAILSQTLKAKASSGDLLVSDKPELAQAKTKLFSQWMKKLSLPEKSLLVLDKKDDKISIASKNLKDFVWVEAKQLHPYQILNARKIILTPEALNLL